MILAGVDEAGLGPKLGPLVTASFAMQCPPSWNPSSPWTELTTCFCATPNAKGNAIAICDSKALHPRGGVAALELAVGILYNLTHSSPPKPLLQYPDTPMHPCYTHILSPFPAQCCTDILAEQNNNASTALTNAHAKCVHYSIHLLYEPAFNHILASGLNKNQLLLEQTGRHLVELVERFSADHAMTIVVDKQGGRNSYGAYLSALFPGIWPVELESGRERSLYRLRPHGHDVMISFQAKADRDSFFTAAASLAAKYTRERAMERLNEWFCARIPDLKPTAGYPQDAARWLNDTRDHHQELQVELLVRNK